MINDNVYRLASVLHQLDGDIPVDILANLKDAQSAYEKSFVNVRIEIEEVGIGDSLFI